MATTLATTFVNPDTLIQQIADITPGATVADFGCGSGYFTFAFAKAIGSEGKVIAVDILPSALEAVASRAKLLRLTNLFTKRANLERENGSGLEAESLDWVIMKDVLFQNANKEVMLREAYRVLRSGGRLLLMEWSQQSEDESIGPESHLRLSRGEAVRLTETIGFRMAQELQAGDFHYAFVVQK